MPDGQMDTPEFTSQVSPALRPAQSGKAVWAFLLGLLGIGLWIFAGVPAIILALLARGDMRRDPQLRGRALANLGLLLGLASFVVLPLVIGFSVVVLLSVPSGSVRRGAERIAHFHLDGMLVEDPQNDPMGVLMGQPKSFRNLSRRLRAAGEDDSVKAVVLTLDGLAAGLANGEEMHRTLDGIIAAGKKVYVRSEEPTLPASVYLMVCGASSVSMAPTAFLDIKGLYGEAMYIKEGLDKIGVAADVVHIGDYKSAGESLIRTEPSAADAEQTNWMFDSLYESYVGTIARSRKMAEADIRALIDEGPYTAEGALKAGLIDSVSHRDEFLEELRVEYGKDIEIDNHYGAVISPEVNIDRPLTSLINAVSYFSELHTGPRKSGIGLIYVDGMIVSGYAPSGVAASGTIRDAIETAAKDENIKAIVMRVNSPGGSATASEVILRAVKQAREKKPVIVSMGSVAASGGYYVSCDADAIFADESTLTASIGVIGGKLVTGGMWDKLGVRWFGYKRGANADVYAGGHPFEEAQRARILEQMGAIYATFKDHVTAGRGVKLAKPIDEIAGGRVFTGKQALDLGLVDRIGGLDEAIDFAAKEVSLEAYDVCVVPWPKDAAQLLLEDFLGSPKRASDLDLDTQAGQPALQGLRRLAIPSGDSALAAALLEKLDPARAQATMQMIRGMDVLDHEGAAMIMPQVLVFP